jgi:hypothetical protein
MRRFDDSGCGSGCKGAAQIQGAMARWCRFAAGQHRKRLDGGREPQS